MVLKQILLPEIEKITIRHPKAADLKMRIKSNEDCFAMEYDENDDACKKCMIPTIYDGVERPFHKLCKIFTNKKLIKKEESKMDEVKVPVENNVNVVVNKKEDAKVLEINNIVKTEVTNIANAIKKYFNDKNIDKDGMLKEADACWHMLTKKIKKQTCKNYDTNETLIAFKNIEDLVLLRKAMSSICSELRK